MACKNADLDRTEVKCYLYDNKNKKRDLSPLIKTKGGYLVNSDSDEELYINVCRDITPEPGKFSCSRSLTLNFIWHMLSIADPFIWHHFRAG